MSRREFFYFKQFSRKALMAMYWWFPGSETREASPYCNYEGIVAEGAIRSTKTISFICGFIRWSLQCHKNENFAICGKTFPALNRNVITELKKILNTWGLNYTVHRDPTIGPYLQIGTNKYFLFEFNNVQSKSKIQGFTLAGLYIDEAALAGKDFVDMAVSRLSVEGAKYWFNCNPEGPYHFIKTDYIDCAEAKRILVLHFTMADNLTLSAERRAFYERQYTGVFYKRYILGLWVAAEGVIYDMWDENFHIIDNPPGKALAHYVGVDYGTGNPTVFLLFGYNPNLKPRLWLEKEYFYDSRKENRQKTDEDYTEDMKKFIEGVTDLRAIIIDPSAASFKLCLNREYLPVQDADNSVLDGIRTQARLLSAGDYCILRGVAPNTEMEYAGFMWDTKAQNLGIDRPLKTSDHTKDAERYVCHALEGQDNIDYTTSLMM